MFASDSKVLNIKTEVEMVPSVLFMCIFGKQRNHASSCDKLGLESNSSFLSFPFEQHPFLRTAVSLSVLPDMICIARKICQAMEALHASSASLEEKKE